VHRGRLGSRGGWICGDRQPRSYGAVPSASKLSGVGGELVGSADLVVADGMPLIWASRLQGTPLPERVAGSTLCLSLARTLGAAKRSLFLLGGNEGIAEAASEELKRRFPGLIIAGTHYPPFGFEKDAAQMESIQAKLQSAQPDVVYVALGSPKQEELIQRLRADLPAAWWLGVGISLSFITGEVRRAPKWMQKLGLEWTHRLAQEPMRLGRRYLIDGLPFAARLMSGSALARVRRWGRGVAGE
jgi:N-acetylglucosaminyldiphosphoundecaprenol N-acetyl-beta-D-mannosaminyltransferase